MNHSLCNYIPSEETIGARCRNLMGGQVGGELDEIGISWVLCCTGAPQAARRCIRVHLDIMNIQVTASVVI